MYFCAFLNQWEQTQSRLLLLSIQAQLSHHQRMSRAGLSSRVGGKGKAEASSQGLLKFLVKKPTPQPITSLIQPQQQKSTPPRFAGLSHPTQAAGVCPCISPCSQLGGTHLHKYRRFVYEDLNEELIFRRRAHRDPRVF